MHKVTRIAFNSADWRHPTGEAKKSESAATYNGAHGFGHEDWLFRSEWQIEGWRYAFIQGVNKSHVKLVKDGCAFDLTLFTIQPDRHRRYVATIHAVECLEEEQAKDALEEFKRRGWYEAMRQEVRAVGGNPGALGAAPWAKHVLNVRFRLNGVYSFPPNVLAPPGDPILALTRYQLSDFASIFSPHSEGSRPLRHGSAALPGEAPFMLKERRG